MREEHMERMRLAQRIEISDLKWLMGDKRGRRFVWRLLETAGPLQEPFNPDPQITANNLGKQAYGRWLYVQLLEECPELFVLMGREAREFRNVHDGSNAKSN
jgi:hypothetical protein